MSVWFALPDHGVLSLTGRDAQAFAQSQSMNDVGALAPGRWQWNGWLTPKGRVIALFALARIDADTFWMLVPDMSPAELADRLRRFVFRSKVVLTARDDLHVVGAFEGSRLGSGDHWVEDAGKGLELDYGSSRESANEEARSLRILPVDASSQAGCEVRDDDDAVLRWRCADLVHGLPRLDASQREHWTPQQLSLDRLSAYSVKKGCYPGQEIVARTHFLGQAKRGLALLQSDGPLRSGETLRSADDTFGTVISTAGNTALAVAGLDDAHDTGVGEQGITWRRTALQSGLAR